MWREVIRGLSTTRAEWTKNRDWKDLKKLEKRRSEYLDRRRSSANPFKGNVGISRDLKYLQLHPDDEGFESEFLREGDSGAEIEVFGDEVSVKRQKSVDQQYKQLKTKEEIKHIMKMKKLFPKQKDPKLLTWIEKETIRHLHKVEPNTWDIKSLSESFPSADEVIIKKILKNKHGITSTSLVSHDAEVRKNWKLLESGKLIIRDSLREHILKNLGSFKQPNANEIPKELTDKVIQNFRNDHLNALPPKVKKGPIGSIISDYKCKIQSIDKKSENAEESEEAKNELVFKNIFKRDQIIYDEANINEPSPYRDTALLDTSVNISKEPHMTSEEFKKKYLLHKTNQVKLDLVLQDEKSCLKKQYINWLQEETQKDLAISKPEILDIDEVIKEIS